MKIKNIHLLISLLFFTGIVFAQELNILDLEPVEDVVPSHYGTAYNKMAYCLNDNFEYVPSAYDLPTNSTPSPEQAQVDDTTCFVALSNKMKIKELYGVDSATFWTDYPLANNVIFEFSIPRNQMLKYLDVWGRINSGADRRNLNFIVELYNDTMSSTSTATFDLLSSTAAYPSFRRVDLSAIGLDAGMLKSASGIRIRHEERYHPINDSGSDVDFLHIAEVRMCTSVQMKEIPITSAIGGENNYPEVNNLPKYLYDDSFVYNPLAPLSSQPDLYWVHPTEKGGYTPGLDTAFFCPKKGADSWVELYVELNRGETVTALDLWTDQRSNQPAERYTSLIITIKDSINNTSWSSPEWSGITHPTHHGRYTFPSDIPDELLSRATSIHISNMYSDKEMLAIFEVRVVGYPAANTAPIANAGASLYVTAGDTVHLDASQSFDNETPDALNYRWRATGMNISDPFAETTTFVAPLVPDTAVYEVMLTVSDEEFDSEEAVVIVTVYPIIINNEAPIANAGSPQFAYVGDTVTLDASLSYDNDTTQQLTYLWISSRLALDNPVAMTTSFVAPDVEDTTVFQVMLRVSDGELSAFPVSTTVTVYPLVSSLSKVKISGLNVFPNPSENGFTIDMQQSTEECSIRLYNIVGALVLDDVSSIGNNYYIDQRFTPSSGIYLLVIEGQTQRSIVNLNSY